jgi:HK97 family phage major capsid protein
MVSNGATTAQVKQDISKLIFALGLGDDSRPFIVMESGNAKALATKVATDGHDAFPGMSPTGGTISNVPVIVSDALTAGQVVAFDAAQVATGDSEVDLTVVTHGDALMDTAPSSPPTAAAVPTPLWQHDLIAVRVLRRFGCERLRTGAAAVISGASYRTGNSPA